MQKYLLKLKDGYILDIDDDFDKLEGGGCPTCGYDVEFISEISFKIQEGENSEWFRVYSSDYFDYAFCVADVLKLIICNIDNISEMYAKDFKIWIEQELFKC